jgi:hypothetical protein
MRQILGVLMEHYDRLIVFVVLLALFASLLHLTVRKMDMDQKIDVFQKQVEDFRPRYPVMAPVTAEPFDRVMAEVKEPFQIPAWSNSMFAPEKRTRCIECLKPAPIDGEKCPFCLARLGPPPPPPSFDDDKDGMRDDWERKYALNPHDKADAALDPDEDGFSNLEEFLLGTVPNDPNSHPDFIHKVRVARAYQVPFKLRFRTHMKGGNDERLFQVNTVDNGKTYIVKLGEKVGEKGDDFVVEKFEFKEQVVTNKSIGGAQVKDVSVLTLARGDKRIPLVLGDSVNWPELRAILAFSPDGTNWAVKVGDRVTVRKTNYVVMNIDSKAGSVVLSRADSGSAFTVGANGVVVVSEAIRSEPEGKTSEAREGE